jgi:hypothetical protein
MEKRYAVPAELDVGSDNNVLLKHMINEFPCVVNYLARDPPHVAVSPYYCSL